VPRYRSRAAPDLRRPGSIATALANTPHHVTIVCDGTDCNVDYFDVTCN